MTYSSDPTRWTQSSGEAPELLREAFRAGTHEGPNDLQMRTLALKLAAIGTGAALAAGASTAHAASTTAAGGMAAGGAVGALKTGGAFTLGKLAASIALVGAVATSAVYLQQGGTPRAVQPVAVQQTGRTQPSRTQPSSPQQGIVQAAQAVAKVIAPVPSTETLGAPVTSPVSVKNTEIAVASLDKPAALAEPVEARDDDTARNHADDANKAHHSVRHGAAAPAAGTTTRQPEAAPVASTKPAPRVSAEQVEGKRQQLSEIDLLRNARAALAAHPREAYRLAEQHKALYPQGVFAQERDALAVEALQRAGDLKGARKLAESFVQRYPSSPHAHRFRETMNLP